MPLLTTRVFAAVNNRTIVAAQQKSTDNNNNKKNVGKSLKPSSNRSNSRSSNNSKSTQISIPSTSQTPAKEIIRKNIGTTLSLTLAVGIGYFLGNNTQSFSQIFKVKGNSSSSPAEEMVVVVNEGKNDSYSELFLIDRLDSATKANAWRVVNDGVMGGVSQSAMMPPSPNMPGSSRFAGTIRLENNGGFASVRRALPNVDASEYKGVYLKCKAAMKERDESKQFLLLAKDAECSRNFANFKSAFTVGDDWEVKLFPFDKCFKKGERMGRPIERGPLNVKEMTELGLMILRGEEAQVGKFGLDVEEFGFYM